MIKNLLEKYQLRPSRGLGQNFLIDKRIVNKVIRAADLGPEDTVLEIGPGLGVLTQELAKKTKEIIAVEKDPNLARILGNELRVRKVKNTKVIQGDILKIKNYELFKNSYKVIANLPFYLTAPVIRKFLEADTPPKSMILIIQKEVGQRICAKPPRMNLLAVSVQFYSQPKIISYVSRNSFWPRPKVDSAIIKISRICKNPPQINVDFFFKVVKAGFSQPRKQLINNLSKKLRIDKIKVESWLWKNNIQPSQRAETLDVKSWVKLTKSFEINR